MSEDDLKAVVDFTNRVLSRSGLDLKASADDGDLTKVQVRGNDVALLLGHNAELLDALEYLGNRILGKHEEMKIVFDSGSYRAQRERELRLMAAKAADKVRASKTPFSFTPMSANERRLIHLALADDATVITESQGSGENRKVTVRPK
jgi:spoIIIJ-associated protein